MRPKNVKGFVFTFGCSFQVNDQHILKAILESDLDQIVIGVFDEDEEAMIKNRHHKVLNHVSRVEFVNTSGMNIWS